MLNILLNFYIHQPYRLQKLNIFDVGEIGTLFDAELNRNSIEKVSELCYLPVNELIMRLIHRYGKRFKFSLFISGTTVELLREYCPSVLDQFKELAESGCTDLICGTYYYSLSSLYDRDEFFEQVRMHLKLMEKEFGIVPAVFVNTEGLYWNDIADLLKDFKSIKVILVENVKNTQGNISRLKMYRDKNSNFHILLNDSVYWNQLAVLCKDRRSHSVQALVRGICEFEEDTLSSLNIPILYETLQGSTAWELFYYVIDELFKIDEVCFSLTSDFIKHRNNPSIDHPVFDVDTERSSSEGLFNDLQKNACETIYDLLRILRSRGDKILIEKARKLTAADQIVSIGTINGEASNNTSYFSQFESPEDSYLSYLYAISDIEQKLKS
jgi:alpha-amylase